MEEPIRLEERYVAAAGSSHLRMNMERSGDVDLLVAAGLTRESLATSICRLRGEFDSQRSADRLAASYIAGLRQQHLDLLARAAAETKRMQYGPTKAVLLMDEAEKMPAQIEREALVGRAFVLSRLQSLDAVTRALGGYALQQAPRHAMPVSNAQERDKVMRVAGRVLESLLDGLCPACEGRGFWGGHGTPLVWHQGRGTCERTGRRKVNLGGAIEELQFGQWMLADLERKLANLETLMQRFLSSVRAGKAVTLDPSLVSASEADLKRRLDDLRSPQANSD